MYSRCFSCGCDYRGKGGKKKKEKQQNISRCSGITQEQWANSCVKVEAVERLLHSHSKKSLGFFFFLGTGAFEEQSWVHVTLHTSPTETTFVSRRTQI